MKRQIWKALMGVKISLNRETDNVWSVEMSLHAKVLGLCPVRLAKLSSGEQSGKVMSSLVKEKETAP